MTFRTEVQQRPGLGLTPKSQLAELLISSLKEVGASFAKSELAYLALTQKVEHAIRDKLAFNLHRRLERESPDLLVCREWKRADLAVVKCKKPLLVLEAKAIYSFDIVKSGAQHPFPKLVSEDLEKAAKHASSTPPDSPLETFALVIATHPRTAPGAEYREAVKYFRNVKKYAVETNTFVNASQIMNQKMAHLGLELLHKDEVNAGDAFGVDVSVFLWLYTPAHNSQPPNA